MKNITALTQKIKRLLAKQYLRFFTNKEYKNLVKSFSITNISSGEIVASKEGDKMFSIGSITKLMTTYMIFDSIADLSDTEFIVREDDIYDPIAFSTAHLKAGEKKNALELLEETIIISACDSANLLGSHKANEQKLVDQLDKYINKLSLRNTSLKDTTGESIENKMSANDINKLANHLIKDYPEVFKILEKPLIERSGKVYKSTFPKIKIGNNNKFTGIKTGYLKEAGRSIVFLIENNKKEQFLVSIIGASRLIERDFFIEELLKEYLNINIKFVL